MDEAVTWFRTFLDTEWAAKTAYYLESDEDAFEAATDAYFALKHEDVGEALNRSGTPEDLADLKKMFETQTKRVLYAARPVTADGEPAWAFYTSNFMVTPTERTMSALFVVQAAEGTYRVQAEYSNCFDCGATGDNFDDEIGDDESDVCPGCEGLGFVFERGEYFSWLEPAGSTTKYEAPTNPQSTSAYEAL